MPRRLLLLLLLLRRWLLLLRRLLLLLLGSGGRRCLWINRFQPDLFRNGFLFRVHGLQGTQIKHQVPSLVRLNVVGKRRHRRAVQTCHKYSVEILVGYPAFKLMALCEVIGHDWAVFAIGQCWRGRTIAATFGSVTLPAFQLLEESLTRLEVFRSDLRLRRFRS